MDSIDDIRIVGLDPKRPPRIQGFPCIDLFFTLSAVAPKGWCDEFNLLVGQPKYSIKIDPEKGEFIETWVRLPDEIRPTLEKLKQTVSACNRAYQQVVDTANRPRMKVATGGTESPEQVYLNSVVQSLVFDA